GTAMAEFFGLEDTDDPVFWKANYLILRNVAEWEGYDLPRNHLGYIDVAALREQGVIFPADLDEHTQALKHGRRIKRFPNVSYSREAEMWRLKARIAEAEFRHLDLKVSTDDQGFYDLDAMRQEGLLPPHRTETSSI